MKFWRQLRWQIASSHFIVVIVGVIVLLVTVQLIIDGAATETIQSRLLALTQADNPAAVEDARIRLDSAGARGEDARAQCA